MTPSLLKLKSYHLAGFALVLTIAQILLIAYWLLWPYDIFTFTKPIEVVSTRVVSGNYLVYRLNYCKSAKYADYHADVQLVFVDHILNYTPVVREGLAVGCHEEDVYLPMAKLPAGSYKLIIYREYKINPIRIVRYTSESPPFEIFKD